MLQLLSNHKEWIQPEWLEYAIKNTGQRMPKDFYDSGNLDYACHDVGER